MNSSAILLGVVSPFVAATLACGRLSPGGGIAAILERLGIALALAVGTTSITFFLWRIANAPVGLYPYVEVAIATLASAAMLVRRRIQVNVDNETSHREPVALRVAALLVTLVVIAYFATLVFQRFQAIPHGEWDAWAMWNMRAAFLAAPSHHWADGFTLELGWAPADYPLLVPASVARLWTFGGQLSTLGPMLVAGQLAAATILIAAGTLLRLGGYLAAAVGLSLILVPGYASWVTSQCADIAVALYVLMAVALLSDKRHGRRMVLAGIALGLAAWSKNEGLVAVVIVPTAYLFVTMARHGLKEAARSVSPLIAGLMPMLVVFTIFKISLAPQSDFVGGMTTSPTTRILDPERHRAIATYMLTHVTDWAQWRVATPLWFVIAWLAIGSVRWRRLPDVALTGVAVVVLLLCSYYAVYLLTTQPLMWQMQVSWGRLVAQVWPTLVWSAVAAAFAGLQRHEAPVRA